MLKNVFYSTLWNKCPRCHQADVFISGPYQLRKFDKMNESCSCCGLKYEKEPGFFQGALYVSYALMAGWFMLTWAVDSFLIHSESTNYLFFLIASIVLFMPLTFRISRLLWLNFFIKYEKSYSLPKQKIKTL